MKLNLLSNDRNPWRWKVHNSLPPACHIYPVAPPLISSSTFSPIFGRSDPSASLYKVSPAVYNEVVNPPSSILGLETPDCSRIVFQERGNRVIPKGKRRPPSGRSRDLERKRSGQQHKGHRPPQKASRKKSKVSECSKESEEIKLPSDESSGDRPNELNGRTISDLAPLRSSKSPNSSKEPFGTNGTWAESQCGPREKSESESWREQNERTNPPRQRGEKEHMGMASGGDNCSYPPHEKDSCIAERIQYFTDLLSKNLQCKQIEVNEEALKELVIKVMYCKLHCKDQLRKLSSNHSQNVIIYDENGLYFENQHNRDETAEEKEIDGLEREFIREMNIHSEIEDEEAARDSGVEVSVGASFKESGSELFQTLVPSGSPKTTELSLDSGNASRILIPNYKTNQPNAFENASINFTDHFSWDKNSFNNQDNFSFENQKMSCHLKANKMKNENCYKDNYYSTESESEDEQEEWSRQVRYCNREEEPKVAFMGGANVVLCRQQESQGVPTLPSVPTRAAPRAGEEVYHSTGESEVLFRGSGCVRPLDDVLGEGDLFSCTCAMPCKASCIPVYQGRGTNSRDAFSDENRSRTLSPAMGRGVSRNTPVARSSGSIGSSAKNVSKENLKGSVDKNVTTKRTTVKTKVTPEKNGQTHSRSSSQNKDLNKGQIPSQVRPQNNVATQSASKLSVPPRRDGNVHSGKSPTSSPYNIRKERLNSNIKQPSSPAVRRSTNMQTSRLSSRKSTESQLHSKREPKSQIAKLNKNNIKTDRKANKSSIQVKDKPKSESIENNLNEEETRQPKHSSSSFSSFDDANTVVTDTSSLNLSECSVGNHEFDSDGFSEKNGMTPSRKSRINSPKLSRTKQTKSLSKETPAKAINRNHSLNERHRDTVNIISRSNSTPRSTTVNYDTDRAKIVRRVMTGDSKHMKLPPNNNSRATSLKGTNAPSWRNNTSLGPRNEGLRCSLDSQKTESTTDSGCNSPGYGSQGSLNNYVPSPRIQKKVYSNQSFDNKGKVHKDAPLNNKYESPPKRKTVQVMNQVNKLHSKTVKQRSEPSSSLIRDDKQKKADSIKNRRVKPETTIAQSSIQSRLTSEDRTLKSNATFMQRYNDLSLNKIEKDKSKKCLSQKRETHSSPETISESGEYKFTQTISINSNLNDSYTNKVCEEKSFGEELKKTQIPSSISPLAENSAPSFVKMADQFQQTMNGVSVAFQSADTTQAEVNENYLVQQKGNEGLNDSNSANIDETNNQISSKILPKSIIITETSNDPNGAFMEPHKKLTECYNSTSNFSEFPNIANDLENADSITECNNNNVRIIPVKILPTDARPLNSLESIPSLNFSKDKMSTKERSRKNAQGNIFTASDHVMKDNETKTKTASKITANDQPSVSELIDSTLLNNLKINGTILSDQFDAIITTLKKVAESMDNESEQFDKATDEIDNELPYGFNIKEMHPFTTPWMKDSLGKNEHHESDHFYSSRPYRRSGELGDRIPKFSSTVEGPLGNVPIPNPPFQRKNSVGSMNGTHNLDFCSEAYSEVAHSTSYLNNDVNFLSDQSTREVPRSFRKVSSDFNINGCELPTGSGSFHKGYLRTESRLRKSMSKSRELLNQLENEYRLLKGDLDDTQNPLASDAKKIEGDFMRLFRTYSSDPAANHSSRTIYEENSSIEKLKQSANKTETPSLENNRQRRRLSPFEGRSIFSFLQRKSKSQSSKSSLNKPDNEGLIAERQTKIGEIYSSVDDTSCNGHHSRGMTRPADSLGCKTPIDGQSVHQPKKCPLLSHNINIVITESPNNEKGTDGQVIFEDSHVHRSLSLPKSFKSERHQPLHPSKTAPSAIFPWRQGRIPSCDQRQPNDCQDEELHVSLLQIKKGDEWDQRQPEGGLLQPRVSISKDSRREKASSSPAISRSSLSHSEWDIRRPWSEVYIEQDHSSILSQSVYRLPDTTNNSSSAGGSDAPLHFGDEEDEYDEGDDTPLSLPYIVPSESTSPISSEGVFQKFKKSLSLRLVKKSSRSESPEEKIASISPIGQPFLENGEPDMATISRRSPAKEEENKSSFLFGHPIFRSSKERRRAKLRDVRSAKCNSGDSGDSGIELASGSCHYSTDGPLSNGISSFSNLTNYESTLMCATDICEENGQHPTDLPTIHQLPEDLKHQKHIRRTCSDIGGNLLRQGRTSEISQSYGRQYSSPQPIKLRPSHKLPNYSVAVNARTSTTRFRRNKGSAHLRRSISQPLDLDKSFENQVPFLSSLLREEQEDLSKKQRRPSVGNLLSDDNTSEEEAETSDSEEQQRGDKSSLNDESSIVYAEALWDHVSLDADELVFKAGDLITVVDSSDKDWWWGRISTRIGWFPSVFVRLLVNQEDHQQKQDHSTSENLWISRRLSLTKISHDQIRANVINEIISTERDFVKHLRDLVEGYLRQVRKRPDMFSKECIATIFGNIEELYAFQSRFLGELEQCIDYEEPFRSCIGECFIRNRSNFEVYSEYCNNHPLAVWKLQELYRQQKFVHFFEACRLLQEMIDISLDGFLLTPVQKICKYPLQLQELLKYTKPSHLDYVMVQGATQAMKEVALLVNERKRRMECLEKIASWQMSVEGWEGSELLDDSSQLIHQGELTKGVGGPWSKEITLFLFDHQAIYCKRDLLKRSTYVYRGRINTDLCEVIDIPDDLHKNATLFHSWKIHCLDKNKTYVFTCKSASEKEKWLAAFRKERQLVACDEEAGFVVTEKQKQVAKMSAKNHKSKPKKPRTLKPNKRVQAMTFAQAQLLVNTESESRSNSLPSRSQPPLAPQQDPKKKANWFSFGVHRKNKHSSVSIPV